MLERIRQFFRKGVSILKNNEKELNSIFEHPKVDYDADEFRRIADSFRIYRGEYPPIEYRTSMGELKKRPYLYLNMMHEVSKFMGSILYNEQCRVSLREGVNSEFVEHVLEHNNFNKNFARYVQVMLATGGLVVKPYWDARTGEFEFSWTLADTFIPLRSNTNDISEAVISSVSSKTVSGETYYYTLLEFHEWEGSNYVISNELYRSDNDEKTGQRVELSELYEDLSERTEYTKLTRPSFVYVSPFGFNNLSPQSPLGIGVCDNAKPTLQQINDAYDAFNWEIRQGKRRVVVSDHFMKTRVDSRGMPIQYFDPETDVFIGLPGNMDDMQYRDITADIRSEQYISSINKFLSTLEMQVGLSVGTFTFDGRSVKTATEIVSENSLTYRTRNSHLANIEHFIQELVIATCELASDTYNENGQPMYSGVIPNREDIVVDFDDGIFNDKMAELDFWMKSTVAGLSPPFEAIRRVHNLTEEEAMSWLVQIREETRLQDVYASDRQAMSFLSGMPPEEVEL